MRIALALAAVAIAALLGIGVYWQQRLAPVMRATGVDVLPTFPAFPPLGPVRQIDLGFVSFSVPERITGELVQHDGTLFLTLGSTPPRAAITICPIVSEKDPEIKQLLHQYHELSGERVATYWNLRKRLLHTQPFSVWSIPFRGLRRTVADLSLLVLKGLDSGGAERIWIYEDANVGMTIAPLPDVIIIQVHDKLSSAAQSFLFRTDIDEPLEVAAAIATSYRVKTTDFSPDSLLAQLRSTGVSQSNTSSETAAALSLLDEEERLRKIAEEVRARRDRRNEER